MNLQNLMDEIIVSEENSRNGDRARTVSPSSVGKCLRRLILAEGGAEARPFTAQQLRVFRAGYLFEKFVFDILEKSGKLKTYQKKVCYRGIAGTLDFIVENGGGERYIVDAKSVHSKKFYYLDRGDVDEGYAMQLTCYHYGALEAGEKLADRAELFYVEKECLLTKTITVKPSGWKSRLDAKIDAIENARSCRELPAELEPGCWQCFTTQRTAHKVPRPIAVKIWCGYIDSCPLALARADDAQQKINDYKRNRRRNNERKNQFGHL